MVNPGVDDYTKTPSQMTILKLQVNGKYSKKRKKTTTGWKPIKRILKPKYKLSGDPVYTFSWPGESNRLSSLSSVTPLQQTL